MAEGYGVQAVETKFPIETDRTLVSGGGFYVERVGVGSDLFSDFLDSGRPDPLVLMGGFDEEVFDPVGFSAAVSEMYKSYRGVVQADEVEAVSLGRPGVQVPECFRIGLVVIIVNFPEISDKPQRIRGFCGIRF